MSKSEVLYAIDQLEKALLRLKSAVAEAGNDELKQDGTLQRFEFTFELMWKVLKVYLGFLGKQCSNPRDSLKEAFRQQLFTDESLFLSMLDDRNLSSHTYDFATTCRIFGHVKEQYLPAIKKLLQDLKNRVA